MNSEQENIALKEQIAELKKKLAAYKWGNQRTNKGIKLLYKELTAKSKRLEDIAFFDVLTDLPNRKNVMISLKENLDKAKRNSSYKFSVLFLDLDHFKSINDSLGHSAGDALIIETGRRIKKVLRDTDIVGRLGGDEFIVLLNDIENKNFALIAAERILKEIAQPFMICEHNIVTNASIGIVLEANTYSKSDDILRDADIAMYSAKSKGKNQFEIFEASLRENALEYISLRSDMVNAIHKKQFQVFYQPILSTQDERIVAVEALIRWNHPEKGLLYPDDFIGIAEKSGLIMDISRWVFHETVKQKEMWQMLGHDIRIAINLSQECFKENNLKDFLREMLILPGFLPQYFDWEISEKFNEDYANEVCFALQRLVRFGYKISMDDFGTRSAGLNLLLKLPIKILKIDKCFIKDVCTISQVKIVVASIISMAHALDMKVIAEGVETKEQFDILKNLKCDEVQGFLFSKALPPKDVEKLFSKKGGDWKQIFI